MLDEFDLYKNLNVNQNLSESDIGKIENISPLESKNQNQETKDSGWRLDINLSMTISFYKNTQMNGSRHVKGPLEVQLFWIFKMMITILSFGQY